jgi:hypothetical protein
MSLQSTQAIGSSLEQLSVNTSYWFPSGSAFNQYRFTWYRLPNGSGCKQHVVTPLLMAISVRVSYYQINQHRPLVPVWNSLQSTPAIDSRMEQPSISTGHWFPSGTAFNQHRLLIPVWNSLQSTPVYLVSITQWIRRLQAIGSHLEQPSINTGY